MKEENTQNNKDEKLESLETYMSDIADVVRDEKMSVVKIASAEQKRRERGDYYKKGIETSNNKIIFIVGGVVLIIIGIFVSYKLSNRAKINNQPTQIVKTVEVPISFDSNVSINTNNSINGIALSKQIEPILKKVNSPSSISKVSLSKTVEGIKEPLSLKEFLSILNLSAPKSLIRSFTDNYMLGVYTPENVNLNNNLFLIIKIKDYNLAYSGMLKWEKTMAKDLFNIFNINISGGNSSIFNEPFKDIIIKNKDARILYNSMGIDKLYYLFADSNTLIISTSQDAVKEIISRLLVKQTKII